MGQQVSFFQALGSVYNSLEVQLGAERIIVIASLSDVECWLEKCAERGYPLCEPEHEEMCKKYYNITEEKLAAKQQFYQV